SSSSSSSSTSSSATDSSSASSSTTTQPTGETASSGSASSTAGSHTHRIQPGETLSSISTAAYGSPSFYPAIVKANPGIDPQRLKVGQTINLPDASAIKPSASDATHASAHIPAAGTVGTAGTAASAAPTIDSTTEYRVQPGDSLHKIALKLYG